jgi:hypothetical protein
MLALITKLLFPGVREEQEERDAKTEKMAGEVAKVSQRVDKLLKDSRS